MSDPFVGKLTYFRVYSGVLKAGSHVYNPATGRKERVGRILQMHANSREERESVGAGEIAAAVGLKQVTTGHTLCDEAHQILLESITFPEPVIGLAVEPKTKADQDKLANALARLSEEDPTFRVRTDEETGQVVISGMGELHLEIIVDRLVREFSVAPTSASRRSPTARRSARRSRRSQGKFVRQTGGRGQYGDAVISTRAEPGQGLRVRQQDHRRRDPQGVHQVGRRGHPRGDGVRHGRRLPRRGRQGRRSPTAPTTTSTRLR